MESFKTQNHNLVLLLLIFISSSLLLSATNALTAPAGQVERATKQQLLASIPPNHEPTPTGSSQLFLTSPSGKYAVFLIRRETSLGAGGFGSDFCYLQVQDSGESVWESECAPVSNVNTCSVMFTDAGLEIFDGSTSAWDNDVDGENLEILELLDSGDMVIRDRDGEQVWKASDNPIINQNCGSIGAPGMAPALPPFASPIHDGKGPFGQPAQAAHGLSNPNHGTGELAADHGVGVADAPQEVGVADAPQEEEQQQLGVPHEHEAGLNSNHQSSLSGAGLNGNQQQPLTSVNQPLLDNTPFDSGSFKVEVASLVSIVGVLGCFGFLL